MRRFGYMIATAALGFWLIAPAAAQTPPDEPTLSDEQSPQPPDAGARRFQAGECPFGNEPLGPFRRWETGERRGQNARTPGMRPGRGIRDGAGMNDRRQRMMDRNRLRFDRPGRERDAWSGSERGIRGGRGQEAWRGMRERIRRQEMRGDQDADFRSRARTVPRFDAQAPGMRGARPDAADGFGKRGVGSETRAKRFSNPDRKGGADMENRARSRGQFRSSRDARTENTLDDREMLLERIERLERLMEQLENRLQAAE